MTKRRLLLGSLLGIVIIAAAGTWWFLLRDTSEAKLGLTDDPAAAATADSYSDSGSTDDTAEAAPDLSGEWNVVAGTGETATTAGYRVEETLAGGIASTTATGRTPNVTGTITVVDDRVTAADITVDMTTLVSDKSPRDDVLKAAGIQTDTFPNATFRLTEPIALPDLTPGIVSSVEGTGELTLHGVTQPVTVALEMKQTGSGFVVQADVPVTMRDFGIDPPNVAGIVTVEDHGSIELLATLER